MLLDPSVEGDDEDDDPTPSVEKDQVNGSGGLCLTNLRGVRWRIGLGILPSYHSSSVDDFRKAVADSRRKYDLISLFIFFIWDCFVGVYRRRGMGYFRQLNQSFHFSIDEESLLDCSCLMFFVF